MKLKGIKRTVFDNDLVLLTENKKNKSGKAVIFVGVRSGSIYETDRLNGGCHFNEHLLFKTNKHRKATEISKSIEWAGGYLNAMTNYLSTSFFIEALLENMEGIIQVLFEASTNYTYDQKEFDLEREVILTEIRNYTNNPGSHAFANLFIPTLFMGTCLEKTVGGTVESMGSVTKKELEDFKKECFSPENMVVVVSGMFDENKLVNKLKDTFGRINPKSFPESRFEVSSNNAHFEKFEERKGVDQAYMALGYRLPGFCNISLKELFALEIIESILSSCSSSRLFQELREKRGIGYGINSGLIDLRESSLFCAIVNGFDSLKLREVEKVVLAEFSKLKNKPVSSREFNGTKNYIISMNRDTMTNITSRAQSIWDAEIRKTPYDFRKWEEYIKKVTKKDVMETACKYLTSEYTLTALVPKGFKG